MTFTVLSYIPTRTIQDLTFPTVGASGLRPPLAAVKPTTALREVPSSSNQWVRWRGLFRAPGAAPAAPGGYDPRTGTEPAALGSPGCKMLRGRDTRRFSLNLYFSA